MKHRLSVRSTAGASSEASCCSSSGARPARVAETTCSRFSALAKALRAARKRVCAVGMGTSSVSAISRTLMPSTSCETINVRCFSGSDASTRRTSVRALSLAMLCSGSGCGSSRSTKPRGTSRRARWRWL